MPNILLAETDCNRPIALTMVYCRQQKRFTKYSHTIFVAFDFHIISTPLPCISGILQGPVAPATELSPRQPAGTEGPGIPPLYSETRSVFPSTDASLR